MNKLKSGVYAIRNKVTGKYYIGSSKNIKGRLGTHLKVLEENNHTRKLQATWNKYGRMNFTFKVVKYCSIADLIVTEQYFIDKYDSFHNGYNSSPSAGSCLGVKHSEETKRKHSLNQKRITRENKKEIKRRSNQAKKQIVVGKFGRKSWSRETEKLFKEFRNLPEQKEKWRMVGKKQTNRLRKMISMTTSEEMSRRSKCRKTYVCGDKTNRVRIKNPNLEQ